MANNKPNNRHQDFQPLSLGPLQWHRVSVFEDGELLSFDGNDDAATVFSDFSAQRFIDQLQLLIRRSIQEGCTSKEIKLILSQHTLGEQHVDA